MGESHPEVALIDSNIGLILHAVGEYEPSLKFLEKALELNIRFHGSKSLKVAVSYHLVARTQSCMGDFRSALQNERETFTIYKSQLGDEHDKTKVCFLKIADCGGSDAHICLAPVLKCKLHCILEFKP